MRRPLDTVAQLDGAFNRGDLEAIVSYCEEDADTVDCANGVSRDHAFERHHRTAPA